LKYEVVSAASILAKEKREEEMLALRIKFDEDFGSGYPADPKTKKFIKENHENEEYASMIRFSWKTVQKLIDASSQSKLF
jgi:ribonuclease HII